MSQIITVLGPIDPDLLGPTLMHEHLFIDLTGSFTPPEREDLRQYVHARVDESILPLLHQHPFGLCLDNVKLEDIDWAVKELDEFTLRGGTALVDCTVPGIGRDPAAVQEVARRTGLHIVQGTGLHIELNHPSWVSEIGVDELAGIFAMDISTGMDGTAVRAGIIGEIGTSGISVETRTKNGHITAQEEKALRAAAQASRITNATVAVHLDPRGQGAFEVIDILRSEGVEPERMIMCHMDANPDLSYHKSVAARGVYIEYDHFGREYYAGHMNQPYTSDKRRIELTCAMVKAGYSRQLLLSQDVCSKIDLRRFGGVGYGHVARSIIPALSEAGIQNEQLEWMLVENPRRALSL